MSLINSTRLNEFWQIFEDDKETANEVAEMFCSYVPELVEDVKSAAMAGNIKVLNKRLHRLKGSIGYLGFIDESNFISEIEKKMVDECTYISLPDCEELVNKVTSLVTLVNENVLAVR